MKHAMKKLTSLLAVLALVCCLVPAAAAGNEELRLVDCGAAQSGDTYTYNSAVQLGVAAYVFSGSDNITSACSFSYVWSGTDNDLGYSTIGTTSSAAAAYAYIDTTKPSCDVTCEVTAYYNGRAAATGTKTWTLTQAYSDIGVSATVYSTSASYLLSAQDDVGESSVLDQIQDALTSISPYNVLQSVTFATVSAAGGALTASALSPYYTDSYASTQTNLLSDVVFYPTAGYEGTVEFRFTAGFTNPLTAAANVVTGTLTFLVRGGGVQSGDILYIADSGENVCLDAQDFVDFWSERYPNGTLDYVEFTSISSGNLYDYYSGGSAQWINVLSTSTSSVPCYREPSRYQVGLTDLTYIPTRSTQTASIRFTAYGATNSANTRNDTAYGTVSILYADSTITPIEYYSSGEAVSLQGADFTEKYKDVMNVSPGAIQIQFLTLPENGTLYRNYSGGKGSALKQDNLWDYMFSASSASTSGIAGVAYEPLNTKGDLVAFACYSGGQLKFVGYVDFGVIQLDPITVDLTCGAGGVTFRSEDFFTGDNSAVLNGYIQFGQPTSGTLYSSYSNGKGSLVTSSSRFAAAVNPALSASSIGIVTYIPSAGGAATIPFTLTTTGGIEVEGTVRITATIIAKTFPDVTSDDWFYPYVTQLVADGIVDGRDDGTFGPGLAMSYGEALKLILLAAGYDEQDRTGSHWASGYLSKAYAENLIPAGTTNLSLDDPVSRDIMAEIACKALGLSVASSVKAGVTGPSDSNNGYVYALYNEGILEGSNELNETGVYVNYFHGSRNIERSSVCKIVCKISEYAKG